jgi:hypothetical protein
VNSTDKKRTKRAVIYMAVAFVAAVALAYLLGGSYAANTPVSHTPPSAPLGPRVPPGAPRAVSATPTAIQLGIDRYTNDYNQLLGTPGADWVVGDMVAHPDASHYTVPIGNMTNWNSKVEIVAGETPAEHARPDKSVHSYSTCDIQQGGTLTYVGTRGMLTLMRYTAPAVIVTDRGTYCTGGEDFFPTPDQMTKMVSLP